MSIVDLQIAAVHLLMSIADAPGPGSWGPVTVLSATIDAFAQHIGAPPLELVEKVTACMVAGLARRGDPMAIELADYMRTRGNEPAPTTGLASRRARRELYAHRRHRRPR